jgi:hydroxypyruvate isomerase
MRDKYTDELMQIAEKYSVNTLMLDLEKIIRQKGVVSPEFMLQVAQNAKEVIRNLQR